MSFSKKTLSFGSTESVHSWSVCVTCVRWSDGSTTIHMPQSQGMGADYFFPFFHPPSDGFTDMSSVLSEIFSSCFVNPISIMPTDYGGTWSAINPELDTVPTVNNSHRSAAYAGSGGGVLEKNDPLDIKYLFPILACSGGNILKNESLVLDDVFPLTTLEIFGTDTGYSYLRPTTPNNEESQKTESEPDDTAGSGGEISEKEDLELLYPDSEILDSVLDGVSSPAIYKESGHPTGSNREDLTVGEDGRLGLTWKSDNASPKPSGCRKRELETCAICKRSYCDLGRYMRRDHGDRNGGGRVMRRFPCIICGRSVVQINRHMRLLHTGYRTDRHQKGARNILEGD